MSLHRARKRKPSKRKPQETGPAHHSTPAPQPVKATKPATALPPTHRLGSFATTGQGKNAGSGVNFARTLSMSGRTDYDFHPESYAVAETALQQGSDCAGCEGRNCVAVSAPVTITYSASTSVTLPSPADYPGLTECEAQNVQNAIDTVLAPHEQEHVDAITPYNGTETVTFAGTFCRADLEQAVADFVSAREATRQQAARDRSDALDPFNFTFDASEGCEDPQAPATDAPQPDETPDTPQAPEPEPEPEPEPDHATPEDPAHDPT